MKHVFYSADKRGNFEQNCSRSNGSYPMWSTGVAAIDACLPEAGISRSGLHEVEPLHAVEMPSLTGFVFALLSRLGSDLPVIWCVTAQQIGDHGHPYAFGLERFGISPAQIVFVKVRHAIELQFALEEAVKTQNVSAVIGEGPRPSFTGSRRLSLLCHNHNRPCFLMCGNADNALGSAALTRWQIKQEQGVEDPRDPFGPGLPTWRVALPRVRSGKTMPPMQYDNPLENYNKSYPWRIAWDDQTHSFRPAAVFPNRAVSQSSTTEKAYQKTILGQASG